MRWFLIGYPVVVAIGGLGIIAWQFDYTRVDWPAWVQAVGSIIGIAVAIWVPYSQHKKTEQAADDAIALADVAALRRIAEIVIVAETHIGGLIKIFESNDYETLKRYFARTSRSQDFTDVADALGQIPLYIVPGESLIFGLMTLKRKMAEAAEIVEQHRQRQFWEPRFLSAAAEEIRKDQKFLNIYRKDVQGEVVRAAMRVSSKARLRAALITPE